jgi:hypothetical protein
LKKVKIYFFTQISESSFLAKKLKIKYSNQILLASNHRHFDVSDMVLNQSGISFETEVIEKPYTSSNKESLLQEIRESDSGLALIAHANFIATGLESLLGWQSEFLNFLDENPTGIWSMTYNGFLKEGSKDSVNFISTLLDVNYETNFINFRVFASSPRYFNVLNFTGHEVVKSSTWKKKAYSEIKFLKNVPESVSEYYLKIDSISESDDSVSYRTKSVMSFDLGRLTIQDTLNSGDWQKFLAQLDKYFEKCPKVKVSTSKYKEDMKTLFVKKLLDRQNLFKKGAHYEILAARFERTTGKNFHEEVAHLAEALIREIDRISETELYFSHGDLCFSNILYDIETEKMILIDPRGIENKNGPYLPLAYDLAKLSQCAFGLYDFTIFRTDASEETKLKLAEQFRIYSNKKIPYPLLRLCEASLFWSLLPLHLDNEENVFNFMLSGYQSCLAGVQCP